MNIKLKAPISTSFAIGVGINVLAGYFIPSITNIRFILLRTGLVLAAVALLVGIINLLKVHFKKMGTESENSGYTLQAEDSERSLSWRSPEFVRAGFAGELQPQQAEDSEGS